MKSIIRKVVPRTARMHYRIVRNIFTDDMNEGARCELFRNYLRWYMYQKPSNTKAEICLANGLRSYVYPDSDSGVANLFSKNVDALDIKFIRQSLKKHDFVLDIGCNVGNRTLALADIIDGALLVDANKRCLERAKENYQLNNLPLQNYHFVHAAVGETAGEVTFSDLGGTDCSNRIIKGEEAANLNTVTVKMRPVDDMVAELGWPQIAFIKLDVEGHDLAALKGARKTIDSCGVRLIRFERWPGEALEPFEEFFSGIGWEMFVLDGEGNPSNKQISQSANNIFARPKSS